VKVSIKKKYLNNHRKCKVTFILPKEIAKNAERAEVLGEFNSWAHSATPMKKMKNRIFVATIELPIGREYQFRYLLDNKVWMNDSDADRFVPTPFGDSENCVLTTYNDTHISVIKANQLTPRLSALDIQPLAESSSEKSSLIENLFSILTGKLQTITRLFTNRGHYISLAPKS
jgi:1,4-alpha-glucan branching enzyme